MNPDTGSKIADFCWPRVRQSYPEFSGELHGVLPANGVTDADCKQFVRGSAARDIARKLGDAITSSKQAAIESNSTVRLGAKNRHQVQKIRHRLHPSWQPASTNGESQIVEQRIRSRPWNAGANFLNSFVDAESALGALGGHHRQHALPDRCVQ